MIDSLERLIYFVLGYFACHIITLLFSGKIIVLKVKLEEKDNDGESWKNG